MNAPTPDAEAARSGIRSAAPEKEEAALLGLPPVAPDDRLVYGDHPDQIVDLYRPPTTAPALTPTVSGPPTTAPALSPTAPAPPAGGRTAPLVVLLHGGFWRVAYDRTHLSPAAAALARNGLHVALAEYRRAGGGGGLPETFDDVTEAVRTAVAAAPAGTPVLVAGHSAGGHLALWAAAHPGPVTAAVAVAPVADLARAHDLRLSNGAVVEFLSGGTPAPLAPAALTARIAETDPVRLPPRVPVTLLHGTDDPDVPVELSRRYAKAHGSGLFGDTAGDGAGGACGDSGTGTGGGAPVVLRELPGVGHYAAVTPGTDAFAALHEALLSAAGATRGAGAEPHRNALRRAGAVPESAAEVTPDDGRSGRTGP
ncbi:alpha/beta hydrolase [Streptomyces olivaceiscleroticus]|uniref:Alpha/beta hydrolase n=1 Tax=Streptomyces olivaceiscleroticus TaxID=68245 RepID=A0ABN1A5Y2_9ACTN